MLGTLTLKNKVRSSTYGLIGYCALSDDLDLCMYDIVSCKEYVLDFYYHGIVGFHQYFEDHNLLQRPCGMKPFRFVMESPPADMGWGEQVVAKLEKNWGFAPTIFHSTNHSRCFVITPSEDWLLAPPLLSYLVLVLRDAVQNKRDNPREVLDGYRFLDTNRVDRFLSSDVKGLFLPTIKENWELMRRYSRHNARFVHDCSGILSFLGGGCEVKEWAQEKTPAPIGAGV